jgi:hypothetical protein
MSLKKRKIPVGILINDNDEVIIRITCVVTKNWIDAILTPKEAKDIAKRIDACADYLENK